MDLAPLHNSGFAIVHNLIDASTVDGLIQAIAKAQAEAAAGSHALRNLLAIPEVQRLADSAAVQSLVGRILGDDAFPVRGLFFDKTPDANWKVAWHQDLSIPVRQRLEIPGFGPWSVKAGVVHVQPPRQILERMITLRIHLDECGATNGALRVVPGSHAHGVLDAETSRALRERFGETTCAVPAGGALVMRPLILHASSASHDPAHRRVVHLEFAAEVLPGELEWAAARSV